MRRSTKRAYVDVVVTLALVESSTLVGKTGGDKAGTGSSLCNAL